MSNAICVFFKDGGLIPVINEDYFFKTGKPKKIGDDAIIQEKKIKANEQYVRLLKSDGMVEDALYLVNLKEKKAYSFNQPE